MLVVWHFRDWKRRDEFPHSTYHVHVHFRSEDGNSLTCVLVHKTGKYQSSPPTMSLIFRRGIANMANLKSASKVVCVGRNYAYVFIPLSLPFLAPILEWILGIFCWWGFWSSDHVKELDSARPKQPFFFLKPPSSIHLKGDGPVIRPKGVDLHYEAELAIIMGKRVKDIEESDVEGIFDAIESTLF